MRYSWDVYKTVSALPFVSLASDTHHPHKNKNNTETILNVK